MDVLLSYLLLAAAPELEMGVSERAAVVLANDLGMLIGVSLFGRFSDVAGRRAVFMTTLLLYSLATGATAFVRSHLELAAVRFVAGLGPGGELPVVASYVSELSPPERRGRNVVLLESFWSLGAWRRPPSPTSSSRPSAGETPCCCLPPQPSTPR